MLLLLLLRTLLYYQIIPTTTTTTTATTITITITITTTDRLCGLVVRVSGYRLQRFRVRFPALPDFLSGSGSRTGYTQPREVN